MEFITEAADVQKMGAGDVKSLHELLRQVPDYRAKRGRRYEAATVLVILLLAKLAGESTLSGIAHWARLRAAWLQEALGLRRLPCANTYAPTNAAPNADSTWPALEKGIALVNDAAEIAPFFLLSLPDSMANEVGMALQQWLRRPSEVQTFAQALNALAKMHWPRTCCRAQGWAVMRPSRASSSA